MSSLKFLPLLDSEEMAISRQRELDIDYHLAAELGRLAVAAAEAGYYVDKAGQEVDWQREVEEACDNKISISPDAELPRHDQRHYDFTTVQVTNETTLGASRRLTECGRQPLALNFANGVVPGGGFLQGATAQEEALCRSSALYATLVNDPMYEVHRSRDEPDSKDWVIYSPNVPIFREDDGSVLEKPWLLSFITCAAPYAPEIGQPRSGDLLQQRIHRILSVCRAYGASSLVLGAWGCGAFKNDPKRTARDFRRSLETDFAGVFAEIVFAVTDWSPERRFLTPFHEAFSE